MATELLQIDPPQLTFVFELKKESSCLVHLANNASHHVAFKVKTTSPKKYCVRPTVGIVKPHGTCDFTVTMQAQRTAPPDLLCKDKFLVQSAVVPFGTTEDDISSDLVSQFMKDNGRHVEEKKLRVVLISPSSSPVNGDLKQDSPNQMPPSLTVEKGLGTAQGMEEDGADRDTVLRSVEKVGDMKRVNDVKLSLAKDSEELKSRLSIMDAKLTEAERTIMKLNEERRKNTREKDLLKQELEMLKKKIKMKRAQEGFPLLFVCVVSLVSMAVGYYIHP
ncbi:Vesicle-associated protein 2-2 [Spatholobus suberectus]|nr:Vesicle-associated protein 2-2 [Spatholobus suberectus]